MRKGHRQSGVALLLVLVVVAIATVVTTAVTWRQHLLLARSENLLFDDQAMRYIRGAEAWAGQILAEEARRNRTDSASDMWAVALPPVPIEGGTISGSLRDLQARFNLNNLAAVEDATRARQETRMRRLLGARELPEDAVEALVDWVDEDSIPRGRGGAEDDYYSRLEPPYLAANAPFGHLTGMVLVRGFGNAGMGRLADAVTVLPGQTPINVNTAPVPVLTLLGLDITQAERAVRERAETPFRSISGFTSRLGIDRGNFDASGLSVDSRYFELTTRVEISGRTVRHFSLLHRLAAGREVAVLQRSQTAF